MEYICQMYSRYFRCIVTPNPYSSFGRHAHVIDVENRGTERKRSLKQKVMGHGVILLPSWT